MLLRATNHSHVCSVLLLLLLLRVTGAGFESVSERNGFIKAAGCRRHEPQRKIS